MGRNRGYLIRALPITAQEPSRHSVMREQVLGVRLGGKVCPKALWRAIDEYILGAEIKNVFSELSEKRQSKM